MKSNRYSLMFGVLLCVLMTGCAALRPVASVSTILGGWGPVMSQVEKNFDFDLAPNEAIVFLELKGIHNGVVFKELDTGKKYNAVGFGWYNQFICIKVKPGPLAILDTYTTADKVSIRTQDPKPLLTFDITGGSINYLGTIYVSGWYTFRYDDNRAQAFKVFHKNYPHARGKEVTYLIDSTKLADYISDSIAGGTIYEDSKKRFKFVNLLGNADLEKKPSGVRVIRGKTAFRIAAYSQIPENPQAELTLSNMHDYFITLYQQEVKDAQVSFQSPSSYRHYESILGFLEDWQRGNFLVLRFVRTENYIYVLGYSFAYFKKKSLTDSEKDGYIKTAEAFFATVEFEDEF